MSLLWDIRKPRGPLESSLQLFVSLLQDVMTGLSCSMSMWASGSWTCSTQRSQMLTVGVASPSTWPR